MERTRPAAGRNWSPAGSRARCVFRISRRERKSCGPHEEAGYLQFVSRVRINGDRSGAYSRTDRRFSFRCVKFADFIVLCCFGWRTSLVVILAVGPLVAHPAHVGLRRFLGWGPAVGRGARASRFRLPAVDVDLGIGMALAFRMKCRDFLSSTLGRRRWDLRGRDGGDCLAVLRGIALRSGISGGPGNTVRIRLGGKSRSVGLIVYRQYQPLRRGRASSTVVMSSSTKRGCCALIRTTIARLFRPLACSFVKPSLMRVIASARISLLSGGSLFVTCTFIAAGLRFICRKRIVFVQAENVGVGRGEIRALDDLRDVLAFAVLVPLVLDLRLDEVLERHPVAAGVSDRLAVVGEDVPEVELLLDVRADGLRGVADEFADVAHALTGGSGSGIQ